MLDAPPDVPRCDVFRLCEQDARLLSGTTSESDSPQDHREAVQDVQWGLSESHDIVFVIDDAITGSLLTQAVVLECSTEVIVVNVIAREDPE